MSKLNHYRLLGRSGLRVSPLSLGAMTFGTDWGWGADRDEVRRIFDSYVERGGNFIDTASGYTNGSSEKLVGELAKGRRDRLAIATKYTMTIDPSDPNAGGNARKSMVRSVERSLKALQTDYIDLFYLHAWDETTPIEEVMRGFDDLVSAGKVVYLGVSDIPAWQVARMQTLADVRGYAPLVALQIEYSLAQRTVERDLVPMARELGLGVIPWSPLASGVLTGKYKAEDLKVDAQSTAKATRKDVAAGNGALNERNLRIGQLVVEIARELEVPPAAVAVRWVLDQPGVTSPILGARTLAQLEQNLAALEVELSDTQRKRLHEASAIELGFPHDFLRSPLTRSVTRGEAIIEARR